MTAARSAGNPRLERQYRRLLLAYPRGFRRRHGDDIVTTLLEMAEPGRSRPAAGDGWHLVISGLRQRLRLPAGRPLVRVSAVLVAFILGAFGAAAGSWLSGQTLTALPTDATVTALMTQMAPGSERVTVYRSESAWDVTTPSVLCVVEAPGWTPEVGRDRLSADGWTVTSIRDLPTSDGAQQHGHVFDATRDGVRMRVAGFVAPDASAVSVDFSPAEPAAALPATITGGLLALLVAWPLAAAAASRMRLLPVGRRRLVTALYDLAMAALVLPASAAAILAARSTQLSGGLVHAVQDGVNASPYWVYATPRLLVPLSVAGLALAVAGRVIAGLRPPAEPVADPVYTAD